MTVAPRFCTTCGSPVSPGERFCHTCGAALGPVQAPPAPVQVTPAAAPPAPAPQAPPAPLAPAIAPPPPAAVPAAAQVVPAYQGAVPRLPGSGLAIELPRPPMRVVRLVVAALIVVAAVAIAIALLSGTGPKKEDPVQPTGNRQVLDVQNIRAEVPSTWSVLRHAGDTIAVKDEAGRTLWLRSAPVATPLTVDQIQQRFLDKAVRETPDAKICAGPEAAVVPGGPATGRYLVICSTFIPQGGGPAVRFADAYYIGVDATGTTVFVMQLTASPTSLEAFAATVRQLPPPVWKLYRP